MEDNKSSSDTTDSQLFSDPLQFIPDNLNPTSVVFNDEFVHFVFAVHCYEKARDQVLSEL